MTLNKYFPAACAVILLAGCASSIIHHDVKIDRSLPVFEVTTTHPIKEIKLSTSNLVKEKTAKGMLLFEDRLARTIKTALIKKKLFDSETTTQNSLILEVTITDISYRGQGLMTSITFPGNEDSLTGQMVLSDHAGKVIKKFSITIDNQHGGHLGDGEDGRMGRLYQAFANNTYKALAEIDPWLK